MEVSWSCKESGHWWGDEPFILRQWKRQKVGERFQTCQRGCGRTRTSRISVRTGDLIGSHVYGGKIAGYPSGTPKSALRLRIMKEG